MVCEECVYKLDLLYEFRDKSIKTESELNNILKELESYVPLVEPMPMSVPLQVGFNNVPWHVMQIVT